MENNLKIYYRTRNERDDQWKSIFNDRRKYHWNKMTFLDDNKTPPPVFSHVSRVSLAVARLDTPFASATNRRNTAADNVVEQRDRAFILAFRPVRVEASIAKQRVCPKYGPSTKSYYSPPIWRRALDGVYVLYYINMTDRSAGVARYTRTRTRKIH